MQKILKHWSLGLLALVIISCSSTPKSDQEGVVDQKETVKYSLSDFYSDDSGLAKKVKEIVDELTVEQQGGQMVVQAAGRLGMPDEHIFQLIKENKIGGVLLLNGSVNGFKQKVHRFDSAAAEAGILPLIYSSDAEPSLINRKIKGSKQVPKTIELNTVAKNIEVAKIISQELKNIGILYDYAPVLDISPDNAAIKNRSYGYNRDSVIAHASAFANQLQENGIAATVKHFPGHGLVKGDTHSKLVVIDGDFQEVDTYKPFIQSGIISVMIGHIAVKNNPAYNTNGLPASCSKEIVTDLLRNELGFKGIITTDAMNMGALKEIEHTDFKSILAGNDIVLMPIDEDILIDQIVSEAANNKLFAKQVYESVSRIIRLKICLGIIK